MLVRTLRVLREEKLLGRLGIDPHTLGSSIMSSICEAEQDTHNIQYSPAIYRKLTTSHGFSASILLRLVQSVKVGGRIDSHRPRRLATNEMNRRVSKVRLLAREQSPHGMK